MFNLDIMINDRFMQPLANHLSNKGINCGYFAFNIFLAFISFFSIFSYLALFSHNKIGKMSSHDIHTSLFISSLSVVVLFFTFGLNFINLGKKIEKLSDSDISTAILTINWLKKGTLSGIMWRIASVFTIFICLNTTFSPFYDFSNHYIALFCVITNYIYSFLHVFMTSFGGCYFTKPKPPAKKDEKKDINGVMEASHSF